MTPAFDPYRKWLGIPQKDQPPHHYRLLGVELFEPDPDVIANAADARMAQVKTFQSGRYAQASQRLLNEIAAAKVTLLNPAKRAAYDAELRNAGVGANGAAPPPPAAPPTPLPAGPAVVSGAASAPSLPRLPGGPDPMLARHRRNRARRPVWPLPLAGLALAALVAWLLWPGPAGPETGGRAERAPARAPAAGPSRTSDTSSQVPSRVDPQPETPQPAAPQAEPEDEAGASETEDAHPAMIDESPGPQGEEDREALEPDDWDVPGDTAEYGDKQPRDPRAESHDRPARLAVPPPAEREAAEDRIRQLFGTEPAAAEEPEARLALAEELAELAGQSADDPAGQFALWRTASELAASAGATREALQIAGQLADRFDVDAAAVRGHLIQKAVTEAPLGRRFPEAWSAPLVAVPAEEAERAAARDDYALADRYLKLAQTAARRLSDLARVRELVERGREFDRLRAQYRAVETAEAALAANPADPEANLTVGRWHGLVKDDWSRGLPHLAAGADADLARLAAAELAGADDAGTQVALADAWWQHAETVSGPDQPGLKERALHWYRRAAPALTGLEQARVERRLQEATELDAPAAARGIRGAVEPGNVALASKGATVTGAVSDGHFLIDGNSTNFGQKLGQGFAYGNWPCQWDVTLDKVYRLSHVRFRLWDGLRDNRHYHYVLAVSADGKTFDIVADHSKVPSASWQEIAFPPRPVRTIRLIGLFNSNHVRFSVVALEAYCTAPKR